MGQMPMKCNVKKYFKNYQNILICFLKSIYLLKYKVSLFALYFIVKMSIPFVGVSCGVVDKWHSLEFT